VLLGLNGLSSADLRLGALEKPASFFGNGQRLAVTTRLPSFAPSGRMTITPISGFSIKCRVLTGTLLEW